MSIDTTNPRVRPRGKDYEVLVGKRWYLVEQDDRPDPAVWRAYTDPDGVWIALADGDPLAGNSAACAEYTSAQELIDVLLAVTA